VIVESESAPPEVCPTPDHFWLWVLETLQLRAYHCGEDVYELVVPEGRRDEFEGREAIRFRCRAAGDPRTELPIESRSDLATCADAAGSVDARVEILAANTPLGERLLDDLKKLGPLVHAAPRAQPISVHELAPHLFAPYDVAGGSVRLGGCSLDDQPLLRYTYAIGSHHDGDEIPLTHCYVTAEQERVEDSLLAALRVDELIPFNGRPPRVSDGELAAWLAYGEQQATWHKGERRAALLAATVIWCKRARGKLLFELGDSTAERVFDVWAQQLVDGTVRPPPFRCPVTGRESYHVVATDDGRITVAESIAQCEYSGVRVLDSQLQTCAVTGRRVLGEFLRVCSVTGEYVLADELVVCTQCRQQVSPHAIAGGRCQACRSLQRVTPDDPRLARILGEYPPLDSWSRWQLAESSRVYVLTAHSLVRRLLLVLDKESLEATHLAAGLRWGREWPEIPRAQWAEFLG
jgi:hypothetical protein